MKFVIMSLALITCVSFLVGGVFIAKDLNDVTNLNVNEINETLVIDSNFDIIDVDLNIDEIRIVGTSEENIKASLKGIVKSSYDQTSLNMYFEESGTRLKLRKKVSNKEEDLIIFDFNSYYSENLVLELEIPKEKLFDLELNSPSSDKIISDLDFNKLTLSGYSGETTLERINVEEIDCFTSSGNIILKSIKSELLECETYSGGIYLDKINSNKAIINTKSGDIEIKDSAFVEINGEAYSGDIEFRESDFSKGTFDSKSGDILLNSKNIGDVEVNTYSGNVDLELLENSNFFLNFRTYSGSFENDFPIRIKENDGGNIVGIVGDGKNSFDISTSSGDLVISN